MWAGREKLGLGSAFYSLFPLTTQNADEVALWWLNLVFEVGTKT